MAFSRATSRNWSLESTPKNSACLFWAASRSDSRPAPQPTSRTSSAWETCGSSSFIRCCIGMISCVRMVRSNSRHFSTSSKGSGEVTRSARSKMRSAVSDNCQRPSSVLGLDLPVEDLRARRGRLGQPVVGVGVERLGDVVDVVPALGVRHLERVGGELQQALLDEAVDLVLEVVVEVDAVAGEKLRPADPQQL